MLRSNVVRLLRTRRGHEWSISAIFKALLQIRPLVPLVPSSAHGALVGHDCNAEGTSALAPANPRIDEPRPANLSRGL